MLTALDVSKLEFSMSRLNPQCCGDGSLGTRRSTGVSWAPRGDRVRNVASLEGQNGHDLSWSFDVLEEP